MNALNVNLTITRGLKCAIISEPDNGQSESINKGFKIAQGKFENWLGFDDFLLEGAWHQIYEYLTNVFVNFINGFFWILRKKLSPLKQRKQ